MFCPTLINPACAAASFIGTAASAVTSSAVGGIAGAIQSGIAWVVSHSIDWWVQIPSPNLAAEPAVGDLQRWLLPVTLAVAVVAMLTAAGKMALTRKANPLIDVGSGLLIIAVTSALGVLLPSMLLRAGDAWSTWALNASTGGQFGARLTQLLSLSGAAVGVVIVLGVVAIIMTAIQAVLMLFRQAALVILAGVLPLAAAGTLSPATRSWFRRVTSWMLALIFYKPAAAAVYATAFTMIGRGRDPRVVLMGFAMVVLSLLALPALMKFFNWTTGAVDGATAGGGFLGTVVSGAIAVGALRATAGGPWGASAIDQARLMGAQLGPATWSGPPGGGVSPGGPGSGPKPGPDGGGLGSGPGRGAGAQVPTSTARWPGATAPGGAGPAHAPGSAVAPGAAMGAGSGSVTPGPGAATVAGGAGAAGGAAASGGVAAAGAAGAAGPAAAAGPAVAAAAGLASGAGQAARRVADAAQPDQPPTEQAAHIDETGE